MLAAALVLSGCVVGTDTPLYDTGAKVEIAGILSCANPNGTPSFMTVAQLAADSAKPESYSYRAFANADGSVYDLLFEQTSVEGTYIAQVTVPGEASAIYLWYDETNKTFTQASGSNDEVKAGAKKYHVSVDSDTMSGDPASIRKLLQSLAGSNLDKFLTCIPA